MSKRKDTAVKSGPMDAFVKKKCIPSTEMAEGAVRNMLDPDPPDLSVTVPLPDAENQVILIQQQNILHERDPARGQKFAQTFTELGAYQPELSNYPVNKHNRKFRKKWYQQYSWLEYSVDKDASYCFPCRVFAKSNIGYADNAFIDTGFNQWTNGVKSFKSHEHCQTHINAVVQYQSLKSSIKTGSIVAKVNRQSRSEVIENREYLKKVIESVEFCGRQAIALRGHNELETSSNRGNFIELMNLRSNDSVLIERLFKNKEKSFTYIHHTSQNEIIELLGQQILTCIATKVRKAKYFALLADESQDISTHEQVAVILRYVDEDFNIIESFVGFHKTNETDGATLAELLKSVIISLGLEINDLRAQCYDGASNMRGPYSGVAARIQEINPLAKYVHCHAHVLNLCIVSACSGITTVRNTLGTINSLHTFIDGSGKRHAKFESLRSVDFFGGTQTLKPLSDTRWSCRIEAVRSLLDNFDTVVHTLNAIAQTDHIHGANAHNLFTAMSTFEFIFTLVLLRRVLTQCSQLSKLLQSPTINFHTVKVSAEAIISVLLSFRTDDGFFNKLWKYVSDICEKNEYKGPEMPRLRKVPSKLGGGNVHETEDVQSFYKVTVLYGLIDTVVFEIRNRFEENNLNILMAFSNILTSLTLPEPSPQVELLSETYSISTEELTAELNSFYSMCVSSKIKPAFDEMMQFFRDKELKSVFPFISSLYKLFLTFPMNSASCERSFSCLRRLKTYMRNTIGQERLSSLALLAIERDVAINYDEIITKFAMMPENSGRRLHLL